MRSERAEKLPAALSRQHAASRWSPVWGLGFREGGGFFRVASGSIGGILRDLYSSLKVKGYEGRFRSFYFRFQGLGVVDNKSVQSLRV